MGKYICKNCGRVFDEDEFGSWTEGHGEVWFGCPSCNGEFELAEQCSICEEYFAEDELIGNSLCKKCLELYSNEFDTCYEVGERDKKEIEINGLLKSIFSVEEIEEILCDYVKEHKKGMVFSEYINEDKHWFAENLVEVLNG